MHSVNKDHILVDKDLQNEILARVIGRNLGDDPDQPAHLLGMIRLMPCHPPVNVYARHAADPVIIDDAGHVVLITRSKAPHAGRLALPGGFMDAVLAGVETAREAAMREAVEETCIDQALLRMANVKEIGSRLYDRPDDIRQAWRDIPGTTIKRGDIFAVSTRGVCIHVKEDLTKVSLKAADDAAGVGVFQISALTPAMVPSRDHLKMIRLAWEMVQQTHSHNP
jgi:ADP-ribose pyrophosphatase YjhB (NUDIX family)